LAEGTTDLLRDGHGGWGRAHECLQVLGVFTAILHDYDVRVLVKMVHHWHFGERSGIKAFPNFLQRFRFECLKSLRLEMATLSRIAKNICLSFDGQRYRGRHSYIRPRMLQHQRLLSFVRLQEVQSEGKVPGPAS
jgi:hypothetical protein